MWSDVRGGDGILDEMMLELGTAVEVGALGWDVKVVLEVGQVLEVD